MTKQELAGMIDHTLLKQNATLSQIEKLCMEAKENGFASVCINPCYVPLAAALLKDSTVKVCTVIGFPLGAGTKESKAFEAADAVKNGAEEVDMVINVGLLKAGALQAVEDDIAAVVQAAKSAACSGTEVPAAQKSCAETPHTRKADENEARQTDLAPAAQQDRQGVAAIVKVIIETCLLTDEEKVLACEAAVRAGADFVKTSTGFSTGGATAEDVALMRKTVGKEIGVKAAGGIHTTQEALALIEAGASRLGASAGIAIVEGL